MTSSAVTIGFSELIDLIAGMYDIPETRKPALRARLKHLKSKDFPPGSKLGRRGRVAYRLDDIARLAVVFALTTAFVPPDVAVNTVTIHWLELKEKIRHAAGTSPDTLNNHGTVYFSANALTDMNNSVTTDSRGAMSISTPSDDRGSGVIKLEISVITKLLIFHLSKILEQDETGTADQIAGM